MTTLDTKHAHAQGQALTGAESGGEKKPLWARYRHGHHWRSAEEEFDGAKLGFWLFLTTEVLLFSGIFVAYAIFRAKYPGAWAEGSGLLDWRMGALNTVVLLISSYTMAMSIYYTQTDQQRKAQLSLVLTFLAGVAFLFIKLTFEYYPKWSEGKRPGEWFAYPFATDVNVPLWWSIYYTGTAIHALHVIIGMAMIARAWWRSRKGHYGPGHYTYVEMTGLYWHLVDLVWIFLFPLLYLIH